VPRRRCALAAPTRDATSCDIEHADQSWSWKVNRRHHRYRQSQLLARTIAQFGCEVRVHDDTNVYFEITISASWLGNGGLHELDHEKRTNSVDPDFRYVLASHTRRPA